MTDLGDAVRQAVALLYAHKRQKLPDKPTLKLILANWAHNLRDFPPEIIVTATSKACGSQEFPDLKHVVDICRAMTGEKHWFDAFEELVRITKEAPDPPGPIPESVVRGFRHPKQYAASYAIQSHPSPVFRKVAQSFLDSFFSRDEAPNMDVIRAQFQRAYDSAQKSQSLQSVPPLLLNEGESPRAIPV